jgi:hypothetical protein
MRFLAILFAFVFCILDFTPLFAESRQAKRFLLPLQSVQTSLYRKDLDSVLDKLIEKNSRSRLFELEALLQVYEGEYPEELGNFLSEHIKPLEDELGRWIDKREALQFAEVVQASPAVLSFLKGQEQSQRDHLKRFLVDKGFHGKLKKHSPLIKLEEALDQIDWSGKKSDRKLVLKSLRHRLKELEQEDYDMRSLEEGLHEFRRDLRWIPIYLRSFKDLFQLDKRPLPEARIAADDPISKNPYSKISHPRDSVKFPILFPQIGFWGLNKAIDQLGKVKDIGKMEELFAKALRATREARSQREAATRARELVKKHPDYAPVVRTASSLYHSLTHPETGLIATLQELLRDQKHWDKRDCKDFLESLQ